MSSPDLSPKLLQALNDKRKGIVEECLNDKLVKQWIDNKVDHKRLQKARVKFRDVVKDVTCLGYASGCNDVRTVQQLVQAGADVTATDSQGWTPLHATCGSRSEAKQKVEYLLSCDASLVRARDQDNNTPLHRAALSGNDAVIGVLIQHGAEVNVRGLYGRTALHDASKKASIAGIHELMRHGADVEAQDSFNKETPLQLAIEFNHADCVKMLLFTHSASTNAANKLGNTALHKAATKGNLEIVRVLTSDSRCNVIAQNNDGKTAADKARGEGHNVIVDYLTLHASVYRVTLVPRVTSVANATPVTNVTSRQAAPKITNKKKVYGKYLKKMYMNKVMWTPHLPM